MIPEARTWRVKRPGLLEEIVIAHMTPLITPSGVLVFQIIRKGEGDQLLLYVHRGFTPPYDFEEILMAESKEVH